MGKYVYWLQEIQKSDRLMVGGKAANLGDLARGLTVPPGFCLSCQAYLRNLEHYGVLIRITKMFGNLDVENIRDIEKVSAEIFSLILATPFLPEIEQAVATSLELLAKGRSKVKAAVRSSATAEDLLDASFAGQQDTYLNVSGTEEVLLSIKKCWASLWTPRAIHYRFNNNFDHETVRMAVIIQEMVPAVVSGVMFTANPVNNVRNEIRIEALRGLGELLVSGQEAGDVYIYKKTGEVNVELVSKTPATPETDKVISPYEMRELAHIGLKIEKFYEDYQDIEWAYCNRQFYFLQTRPITTLADEDLPNLDRRAMNVYQREIIDWVAERYPEPVHPIDGVTVKIMFMAQFEAMKAFGFKIEEMDWYLIEKGVFPEFFAPPLITPRFRRLFSYLRLAKTLKSKPAKEWANEQIYLLDLLEKLKKRDISKLPLEIIIDYITEAYHHFHFFNLMRYRYFVQNKIPSSLLLWFLKLVFGKEADQIYGDLLAGSDNVTLEINRSLRGLTQVVRENPDTMSFFKDETPDEILKKVRLYCGESEFMNCFNSFMTQWGERETSLGLGGIASPTWQDAPEVVIGIIKSLLNEDGGAGTEAEARRQRASAAEDKVNARLQTGFLAILRLGRIFKSVLSHARSFTAFRENSHYDITRSMHVFRMLFTDLGRRFVERGILREISDIFYLSYNEIKEDLIMTIYYGLKDINVKGLAQKIEARRCEQERRFQRWKFRHIDCTYADSTAGVPASGGIISGPARIVRDPMEFYRVQKGDIIIAPYTNPAWTPLFTMAGGLVAETGGAASHAAIIAREYGLPAVMNVVKATELFEDGELITINGATGSIYRGVA